MIQQIQPNHADHISYYKDKYLNEMFEKEMCCAQLKYDGERMLIHIDEGKVYCTSRRISKKTGQFMENQERIPVVNELFKPLMTLDYTVIDCECYSKDWSTIAGILHSLPERAIELQKENEVKFACFDCLFFCGQDIRDEPYITRLSKLNVLLDMIDNPQVHLVKFISDNKIENEIFKQVESINDTSKMMNFAIDAGFEGIVVKSLDRKYYDKAASLKCKKFETLDVVVCGYQQGRGKYADTIGALEIGYYDKESDSVIKISKVNCGTDDERNFWRDNWSTLKNSVIEVKCQEITSKSLRHPVYIRRRDDKEYTMCTKETIFKN